MLLITAQPIRNLRTPASADMNKRGFLEQASPPPLPNPPPLFPFLLIPYPLPVSTPATQATAILSLRNNGGLLVVYWWMDRLTPPLPMKLMKNLLQRASMDKMTRIRSPWMLADRKGSGRGQWTRSFSFIKIWLVHFQVFSILFQNNFRYLVP